MDMIIEPNAVFFGSFIVVMFTVCGVFMAVILNMDSIFYIIVNLLYPLNLLMVIGVVCTLGQYLENSVSLLLFFLLSLSLI